MNCMGPEIALHMSKKLQGHIKSRISILCRNRSKRTMPFFIFTADYFLNSVWSCPELLKCAHLSLCCQQNRFNSENALTKTTALLKQQSAALYLYQTGTVLWSNTWDKQLTNKKGLFCLVIPEISVHTQLALLVWGLCEIRHYGGDFWCRMCLSSLVTWRKRKEKGLGSRYIL